MVVDDISAILPLGGFDLRNSAGTCVFLSTFMFVLRLTSTDFACVIASSFFDVKSSRDF